MPFTLSHPAAILPFLSRSRSVSWKAGLVMGSMAPDLWFLLPGLANRQISHGRFGILVDPPAALFLAWAVVHWMLPGLSLLPGLDTLDKKEPFRWGIGYLGSVIGVATHLVWDQFTHSGSRFLANPLFSDTILYRHGSMELELGMGIWYLNSLVGAVVLLLWLNRRMRSNPEGARILLTPQWALVGVGFLVPMAFVLAWLGDESMSGPGGIQRAIHMGLEMRLAGFLAVLCALAAGILSARWIPSVENHREANRKGDGK